MTNSCTELDGKGRIDAVLEQLRHLNGVVIGAPHILRHHVLCAGADKTLGNAYRPWRPSKPWHKRVLRPLVTFFTLASNVAPRIITFGHHISDKFLYVQESQQNSPTSELNDSRIRQTSEVNDSRIRQTLLNNAWTNIQNAMQQMHDKVKVDRAVHINIEKLVRAHDASDTLVIDKGEDRSGPYIRILSNYYTAKFQMCYPSLIYEQQLTELIQAKLQSETKNVDRRIKDDVLTVISNVNERMRRLDQNTFSSAPNIRVCNASQFICQLDTLHSVFAESDELFMIVAMFKPNGVPGEEDHRPSDIRDYRDVDPVEQHPKPPR